MIDADQPEASTASRALQAVQGVAVGRDRWHADAHMVQRVLGADVEKLLRTHDPEVFEDRLLRLNPDGGNEEDAGTLDRAVTSVVYYRRHSWRESAARVMIMLAYALAVLAAVFVALSWAVSAYGEFLHIRQLRWPMSPTGEGWVAWLLILAFLLGYGAVWLRGLEEVRRARLACRLAAVHDLDSWPGIALDPPFAQLSRRWSFPAWSMIAAGAGYLVFRILSHHSVGGAVLWLLMAVLVGGGLLVMSARTARVDVLASRTLFVGR